MALSAVDGDNRRGKTLVFLSCCFLAGATPHIYQPLNNFGLGLFLAFLLGGHGLRVVSRGRGTNNDSQSGRFLTIDDPLASFPSVDILVAAKDEEKVVERLVEMLQKIEYPEEKISFWIIDDGSNDKTPFLLNRLTKQFPNLNVLSRSSVSGGGKSGALNDALKKTSGDWIFVLDADAQLQKDVLLKLIYFAQIGGWSAVQLRKAVVNSNHNLLATCQAMEMAMDTVIQLGRLSTGGIVELRGNGQLINRKVLDYCGCFNESTVTDDLDLSFRLLLARASIGILWDPPVEEEAVESISSLLRQRQRWAEGGLQRFFDYWPLLLSKRLNITQKKDLFSFFLLQYALPVISLVDCCFAVFKSAIPLYWPLSLVAFFVSGIAYWKGCRTISQGPRLPAPNPFRLLSAILYLTHWFIVIPIVALKMSLLPKTLVWAKTDHQGD